MLPNIGGPELIIILVIALVIIGPGKLPEVGQALGKSIREFRRAATDVKEAASLDTPPPAPYTPPPVASVAPVAPPAVTTAPSTTGAPTGAAQDEPQQTPAP